MASKIICSVDGRLSPTQECGYVCIAHGCHAPEDFYCTFKEFSEGVQERPQPVHETVDVVTVVFPDGKTIFIEQVLGQAYVESVINAWRERNAYRANSNAKFAVVQQTLFKEDYLKIVAVKDEEDGNNW